MLWRIGGRAVGRSLEDTSETNMRKLLLYKKIKILSQHLEQYFTTELEMRDC
jgi:hypothetical protein